MACSFVFFSFVFLSFPFSFVFFTNLFEMATEHDWHHVTFHRPTNCQLCRSLLWGLVNQGVVCKRKRFLLSHLVFLHSLSFAFFFVFAIFAFFLFSLPSFSSSFFFSIIFEFQECSFTAHDKCTALLPSCDEMKNQKPRLVVTVHSAKGLRSKVSFSPHFESPFFFDECTFSFSGRPWIIWSVCYCSYSWHQSSEQTNWTNE